MPCRAGIRRILAMRLRDEDHRGLEADHAHLPEYIEDLRRNKVRPRPLVEDCFARTYARRRPDEAARLLAAFLHGVRRAVPASGRREWFVSHCLFSR